MRFLLSIGLLGRFRLLSIGLFGRLRLLGWLRRVSVGRGAVGMQFLLSIGLLRWLGCGTVGFALVHGVAFFRGGRDASSRACGIEIQRSSIG
jgi:hypothetical protein